MRDLMIEYILFAFDEQDLFKNFQVLPYELESLSDTDLLEIYDQTLVVY
jgi:hypothetical protein